MINVNITTLERRFSLKSVTSGWIATFYDLGSLLTVIPITYFGGRPSASKPRYFVKKVIIYTSTVNSSLAFNPKLLTQNCCLVNSSFGLNAEKGT